MTTWLRIEPWSASGVEFPAFPAFPPKFQLVERLTAKHIPQPVTQQVKAQDGA